jgi:hypothetical protein
MESSAVKSVSNRVYSEFPELRGVKPRISSQPGDKYLLVFSGSVTASNGQRIQRSVRVVANSEGRVIKLTTSR